jgi:hypothetical protein
MYLYEDNNPFKKAFFALIWGGIIIGLLVKLFEYVKGLF